MITLFAFHAEVWKPACSIRSLNAAWGVCGNWAKGTFLVLYKSLVLVIVLSFWRKYASKNHACLSLIRIWGFFSLSIVFLSKYNEFIYFLFILNKQRLMALVRNLELEQ